MKTKSIVIAIFITVSLLLGVPTYAYVLGENVDKYHTILADGAVLTTAQYWSNGRMQTEHYISISPEGNVSPVVVSGNPLWGVDSVGSAVKTVTEKGQHVIGGTNGGYYTVATGEPVGIVVSDGVMRADDASIEAAGFKKDGTVIFGKPGIRMTLNNEAGSEQILGLNHITGDGLRAWTSDYASEVVPDGNVWCMLCGYEGGIPISGEILLRTERIWESSDSVRIPDGKMLFLLQNDTEKKITSLFSEGSILSLKCSCNEGWEDVVSAIGILYPLVKDGKIMYGLGREPAPRTAVGVKVDGTFILYTIDGRQNGYSLGTGLRDVAERLLELGCVNAGALDGGGSTQMIALMPGDNSISVINRPSDGVPRRVANYILLTIPEEKTGEAVRLIGYPQSIHIMAGTEMTINVVATDRNGYTVKNNKKVEYEVSDGLGLVADGVFLAAGTGMGNITITAEGLEQGKIPIYVTESPDTIEVYGEIYKKNVKTLTLEPGQEVDLTVRATDNHVSLISNDSCFTWSIPSEVGTIDESGHLVPGEKSGTGILKVGTGTIYTEIPITIWTGVPFTDIAISDTYFNAVKYLYEKNIFKGTSETLYEPETIMNRAMLVTVLWRMCGCPDTNDNIEFEDVSVSDWFGCAVNWATAAGLVKGYNNKQFAPLDPITIEQLVTILHRYAGTPVPTENRDLKGTKKYAETAIAWALEKKLVDTLIESGNTANEPMKRAMVAEVLYRFSEII